MLRPALCDSGCTGWVEGCLGNGDKAGKDVTRFDSRRHALEEGEGALGAERTFTTRNVGQCADRLTITRFRVARSVVQVLCQRI